MKKRGISPLIATVLIVGFTILLAVIIISFIGSEADTQINQTQTTINIYTTNLDFDFECTNIINETDPLNPINSTEILVINDYTGNLDSVVILFEDGTTYHNAVNLTAFENKLINYTDVSSSEIEIIPQVIIDGVLQGLEWEAKTKTCSYDILLSGPQCDDGTDNDGDGYSDSEDPDCWEDMYDSSTYNSSIDGENGTWSCNGCLDCETDINNGETSDGNKYYIFNKTGSYSSTGDCISLDSSVGHIIMDCNGVNLNGSGSYQGVQINQNTNATIKRCKITNFGQGIYLNGTDIKIINNSFEGNEDYAINVGGGNSILIKENLETGPQGSNYFINFITDSVSLIDNYVCYSNFGALCFYPLTLAGPHIGNTFNDQFFCGLTEGIHYTSC